eukprot:11166283-Lingulodinium_polyedra.AAC.1
MYLYAAGPRRAAFRYRTWPVAVIVAVVVAVQFGQAWPGALPDVLQPVRLSRRRGLRGCYVAVVA